MPMPAANNGAESISSHSIAPARPESFYPQQQRPRRPDYGQLALGNTNFNTHPSLSMSGSSSGSAEYSPIASPVFSQMPMQRPHHTLSQKMLMPQYHYSALNQQSHHAVQPQDVAPALDSMRVAQVQAECEAKLQLARVRVAELEERLRIAENEGDAITMQMTQMEVLKAEAERTRDNAVTQLEQIVELIKGNSEEAHAKWLEIELQKVQAEKGALVKALEEQKQEFDARVEAEVVRRVAGMSSAHPTIMSMATHTESTHEPQHEDGKPKNPSNSKVKDKNRSQSDDADAVLAEILQGLQAALPMEEAINKAARVRSTKHFVTQAYLKGISCDKDTANIEQLITQFACCTMDPSSLLEGIATVARQLGTLRKNIPVADSVMAGYTAALIASKVVTAKQVYDAVTKGAGKKPGKKIAVMLAQTLKDRIGENQAAMILNGKGGLNLGHVVGLEWLQRDPRRSPEESDYCTDSRSASDDE